MKHCIQCGASTTNGTVFCINCTTEAAVSIMQPKKTARREISQDKHQILPLTGLGLKYLCLRMSNQQERKN